MFRKFGPRPHNSQTHECAVCHRPFAPGDHTTLVPIGPGSKDGAERAADGRPYNALAVEVHWDCRPFGLD
jgi:hypothetical protein